MSFHYIEHLKIGDLDVGDTINVTTINEGVPGGGLTINGDLTVNGDLTKINSIDVVLKDSYVYLGSGYDGTDDKSGGLVINVLAEDGKADSFDAVVGQVLTTSNTTNFFDPGELVEINGGLYEVDSHIGDQLTIRLLPIQDFSQKILDVDPDNPSIQVVHVSVIKVFLNVWSLGQGSNADTFTYTPINTTSSLQDAYDVNGSIVTTTPLTLKGNAPGTVLQVLDSMNNPIFEVDDTSVTIDGKLNVTGLIDPTGLQLDPVPSNPGTPSTIWCDNLGKLNYDTSFLLKGPTPVPNNGLLKYSDTSGDSVTTTPILVDGADVTGINTLTVTSLVTSNVTTGSLSFTGPITTDTISEKTLNAGVTVDSVLLKDNGVKASNAFLNNISESTLSNGVRITGLKADTIGDVNGNGVNINGLSVLNSAVDFGTGYVQVLMGKDDYLFLGDNDSGEFIEVTMKYTKINDLIHLVIPELFITPRRPFVVLSTILPKELWPKYDVHVFGVTQKRSGIVNDSHFLIRPNGDLTITNPDGYPADEESGTFQKVITYYLD